MPPLVGAAPARVRWRALVAALALWLGLAAGAGGVQGDRAGVAAGHGATWIRFEGPLSAATQSILRRGIETAKERGDRLVIEFDTPGGSLDVMTQLARTLERARTDGVVVVGWVSGRALSAGALIAMVADQLYMRTSATLGAAAVIEMSPGGIRALEPEDPIVAEKTLSAYRAEWRAWAEQRGRPGALAAAMVDPELEVHLIEVDGERRYATGAEWDDLRAAGSDAERIETIVPRGQLLTATGPEAVRYGLANGIAESPEELLAKVSAAGRDRFVLEPTRSESLAAFFASISGLLIVLGIVLAWIELQQPGLGLPGLLAAVCFGLLLFGRYLTGLADVPHYVLIALGVLLIALELLVFPGTLIAGITGALFVFVGLVWSGLGPGMPFGTALERAVLIDAARATLLWAVAGVAGGWIAARLLPRVPFLQPWLVVAGGAATNVPAFASGVTELSGSRAHAARIGATGVVIAGLRPVGLVELDELPGQRLEAQVDGDLIEPGVRVRVIGTRTGRLVVERAEVPA